MKDPTRRDYNSAKLLRNLYVLDDEEATNTPSHWLKP